jgi:diacylglycerol kinase (ATP)
LNPEGKIDDGVLEVVVIGPVSKKELVINIPSAYRGSILDHPAIDVYHSRRIKVVEENPSPKMVDGDLYGTSPVDAGVLHKHLKVISP